VCACACARVRVRVCVCVCVGDTRCLQVVSYPDTWRDRLCAVSLNFSLGQTKLTLNCGVVFVCVIAVDTRLLLCGLQ